MTMTIQAKRLRKWVREGARETDVALRDLTVRTKRFRRGGTTEYGEAQAVAVVHPDEAAKVVAAVVAKSPYVKGHVLPVSGLHALVMFSH